MASTPTIIDDEFLKQFIERNRERSLDEWYETINKIYWNRLFYRTPMDVLAHLVEVSGGLSVLATERKKKDKVNAQEFIVKAISWWLTLCGKMNVCSVSDLIWRKYPGVCPYCEKDQHDTVECARIKRTGRGLRWEFLGELGKKRSQPRSLGAWQKQFVTIYPPQDIPLTNTFGRLSEELSELAEAVRVFPLEPGYFLSEAADVFNWIMYFQNVLEHREGVESSRWGHTLEESFCRMYPDLCTYCKESSCTCAPIVESTIGRIASEAPLGGGEYGDYGIFMTPDTKRRRFHPRRGAQAAASQQ